MSYEVKPEDVNLEDVKPEDAVPPEDAGPKERTTREFFSKLGPVVEELAEAKGAERAAKDIRIALEEKVAEIVVCGDNATVTVDSGQGLRVTVKRAMSYKADVDAIVRLGLPEEVLPLKDTDPVPAGVKFDEKEYERIRVDHPDVFAQIAPLVDASHRKVSVTLKIG